MARAFRRLAALASSAALLVGASSLAGPACENHLCDPSTLNWNGSERNNGIWETTPVDGMWLDYPGGRTYNFAFDRTCFPINWVTYISADNTPNGDGGNWTVAGGNVAEISNAGFGYFSVTNASCSEYSLRVTFECGSPNGNGSDGAAPTDAARD